MSSHLRDDNECQNCGYTVDRAYCSNCGQKNTETRQPFHHLFTHFVEDLTHYDGAFWKTIKHLLFRPGRLTREYLEGKRQTYVPPVKLYIFISFVTFFLMSFLLKGESDLNYHINTTGTEESRSNDTTTPTREGEIQIDENEFGVGRLTFHSVKEIEEYQKNAPSSEKLNPITYWLGKASLNIDEKDVSSEDIANQFFHTLPKVIFLYMPIFAFWLWLFHSKKRWYFFDHGIFTLHYFSLLLLLIIINMITAALLNFVIEDELIYYSTVFLFGFFLCIYAFFYFFRSHRRMYGEKRWISRTKGFILFWINYILIVIALIAGMIYAMLTVH
jgi:hypothetical protein